jgi:hypothetical protein
LIGEKIERKVTLNKDFKQVGELFVDGFMNKINERVSSSLSSYSFMGKKEKNCIPETP